jgi:uncharacterized protein
MKHLLFTLVWLISFGFSQEELFDPQFWQTATVEDVQSYIAQGIDWSAKSESLYKTIGNIAFENVREPEVLGHILQAGADINSYFSTDSSRFNDDMVKLLLQAKWDINTPLPRGSFFDNLPTQTLFMMAAERGKTELLSLLLEAGATDDDHFAFLLSARSGSIETVQWFLDKGYDINQVIAGSTPFHKAALYIPGNIDYLRFFLEAGADPNAEDDHGCTPFIYSSFAGGTDSNNPPEVYKLFLDAGADATKECETFGNVLVGVLEGNGASEETLRLLLDAGANPNVEVRDGDIPLHMAAQYWYPEQIKMLLAAGAEINLQNKDGMTALMKVAQYTYIKPDIVQLLLDSGADIRLKSVEGKTAWDYNQESPWYEEMDSVALEVYNQLEILSDLNSEK